MKREAVARRFVACAVLQLAVLTTLGSYVAAQLDRGAIVGRIVDSSGAVIPHATVVVANKSTGVALTVQSNDAGEYQFLTLSPGTYSVKVSATGFQTQVRDNIGVHVQDRLAIDATLKPGAVTQEVLVTGVEPLLHTETADVGAVVDSRQANELPLNGRRYADLALLEPGVQKYYGANNPAPDRFSANGNMETQNNFLLDGIDNNSFSENLQEFSVQVVQPPPDALEEFRVQTRTYSAEFGNSAGAVINATVKSGTNSYHGNLFEYLRNSVFDATPWNATKGRFTQNQFGGTFGGPILKDKLFFFGDYQRFSSRRATAIRSTVPTRLMKQGNFTELTQTLTDTGVASQAGCIVGNIIQSTSNTGQPCIDPVAANLVALFPDPNISTSWTGNANYIYNAPVPDDVHSADGRVDYSVNQTNHISGRYSYYHVNRQDPPWTANAAVGNGNFATEYRIHTQQISLGWTKNISNAVFNDVRFGFNRDFAHSDPVGVTLGKSLAPDYGLTGIPVTVNTAGLPPIEINGLTRMGTSPWRPQFQISQAWNLVENLGWLKGAHSFKFGFQYLKRSDNFADVRAPQGELYINGLYSAAGTFGLPDFLLGDASGTHFSTPLVVHYYTPGYSFYGMDTWRATPKLTVTYGLRYELFSPLMDRNNRTSNFSPADGGTIVTAASGASGWRDRALINPDLNDFAPRLGIAYQLNKKMVVRTGYSVFYQHINRIGSESLLQLNPPFLQDVEINTGNAPFFQLQNGYPLSTITGGPLDLTQLQIRAQDPNQRSSYIQQTSLGLEYEVFRGTVASATYVGNWGRKMNRLRDANQSVITGTDTGCPVITFPYANLNSSTVVDTYVSSNPTVCGISGSHAFLELATNDGNTSYNGLELSLRRNMAKGIGFAVNYTWSHGLADFGDNLTYDPLPQNAYDYAAQRSNSILDIQQRFIANFTWELPFGKGKSYLNTGGATNAIVGGWQFNGVVNLQTGAPFSVNAPDRSYTGFSKASYPDCIGDPFAGASKDPHVYTTTGFYINPAAFALPAPGSFGTCRPRAWHGPGLQNWDLSLFKQFELSERFRLQFRTEFFNAFNHPNFSNPSNFYIGPGTPGFGVVTSTLSPILGTSSGGPGDPREVQFVLKLFF